VCVRTVTFELNDLDIWPADSLTILFVFTLENQSQRMINKIFLFGYGCMTVAKKQTCI